MIARFPLGQISLFCQVWILIDSIASFLLSLSSSFFYLNIQMEGQSDTVIDAYQTDMHINVYTSL